MIARTAVGQLLRRAVDRVEIARAEGLDLGRTSRIARLARLAADIVEACMAGKDHGLMLDFLVRRAFPVDWSAQRQKLLTPRE